MPGPAIPWHGYGRGVVWCGVVWCGVVWCCVVQCAEGAVTTNTHGGALFGQIRLQVNPAANPLGPDTYMHRPKKGGGGVSHTYMRT